MPVTVKKKRKVKPKAKPSKRGNCYVTSEAVYHLLGGKKVGLTPHTVRHEGDVHWYLVWDMSVLHGMNPFQFGPFSNRENAFLPNGIHVSTRFIIIDLTVSQFKTKPPYHLGRGRGFLTDKPSKQAVQLMQTLVWQNAQSNSQ